MKLIESLRYKADSGKYSCRDGKHEPDTEWCSGCIMRAAAERIDFLEDALSLLTGKKREEVGAYVDKLRLPVNGSGSTT